MRKILGFAAALAMLTLCWNAEGAARKRATAHKGATKAVKSSASANRKAGTPVRKKSAGKASPAGMAKSAGKASTTGGAKTARTSKATGKATHGKAAGTRRGKKVAAANRTTWRNRQLSPTPERYKQIQEALAAKGYLAPEEATGSWNQSSVSAMKKFQQEQNITATGKVNSLSLIALGLGPKRESAATKPSTMPVVTPPQQP